MHYVLIGYRDQALGRVTNLVVTGLPPNAFGVGVIERTTIPQEEIAAIEAGEIDGDIYGDGEVYADPMSLLKFRQRNGTSRQGDT